MIAYKVKYFVYLINKVKLHLDSSFFFRVVLFDLLTRCVLSPFRGGGIAYLNDPDSYAG